MQIVDCIRVVVMKTGFEKPDSSLQFEDGQRGAFRIRHYIVEVGLGCKIATTTLLAKSLPNAARYFIQIPLTLGGGI